jgi:SAM-dependent methyltransferase
MEHDDHVALIRDGVARQPSIWADLGSGHGAFTLALADLLGPGASILSLDRDARALRSQEREMAARFPEVDLVTYALDYTRMLPDDFTMLDGIIAANALHFQTEHARHRVLRRLFEGLKPGGTLIVVEYNTDRGNRWVPYPFSFTTWQRSASAAGFVGTRLLKVRPSRFLGEIYSSACEKPR